MLRVGIIETNESKTLFSLHGTSQDQIDNALNVIDGQ